MAKYDYRCELNGQAVEVSHAMNETVNTWGELCTLAGIEAAETPADSPVHKIIRGGFVATGASPGKASHSCIAPTCCNGGACAVDG